METVEVPEFEEFTERIGVLFSVDEQADDYNYQVYRRDDAGEVVGIDLSIPHNMLSALWNQLSPTVENEPVSVEWRNDGVLHCKNCVPREGGNEEEFIKAFTMILACRIAQLHNKEIHEIKNIEIINLPPPGKFH